MVLSCLTLDARSPSVRQCLANAHDMHRNIMAGFEDIDSAAPRSDHGVLYHLQAYKNEIRLYILSKQTPNWERLSKGFAMVDEPKDISGVVQSLRNGRSYAFSLMAEPSKKQGREGALSRRVFLATEEERMQWLKRKAQQNGFGVRWVREDGQTKAYVHNRKGDNMAVHTGVLFRGELVVTDEVCFQQAFCQGIGAGKAYGMGMLMLYPIRR